MHLTIGRISAVLGVILALVPAVSLAVDCTVPTPRYPTVQSAINDTVCTTINLSDQSYPESILINRSLSILGPAGLADIEGYVQVRGAGTVVQMDNLMVHNGCQPAAFLVTSEGHVDSTRLEVEYEAGAPCPAIDLMPFSDGFESGNTLAWSSTVP